MRRFVSFGPAFVVLITCAVALFATPALLRQYTFANTEARISLAQQTLEDDPILERIDRAVAAVADKSLPSVVHIDVLGRSGSLRGSSGAGWIYDRTGHIVTNAHVVRGAQTITVELHDGRSTGNVRLLGTDPYTDIAVLEVSVDGPLFPAELALDSLPAIGQQSFAFGSPFGFKFSMSQGIVSGLGRGEEYGGAFGGYTNYIQTDAAVNPGNSGGPLMDVHGQIIGMNVAIATARGSGGPLAQEDGGDSAGISFAIPLGTIIPIVDQLISYGSVERGFIGIDFGGPNGEDDYDPVRRVAITDPQNPEQNAAVLTGIRVNDVTPDGASQKAGLMPEDIIVEIENNPVLGVETLRALIASRRPGTEVNIVLARDGELLGKAIILDPMSPLMLARLSYSSIRMRLGMDIVDTEEGPIVAQIYPGSPASAAGFLPGDLILSLANQSVSDLIDFYSIAPQSGLFDGRDVPATVKRLTEDGNSTTETLTINFYP
ncbi:MAG: S1-C subfamily serine protease [Phycisphaerales bacterium]|jgi:S1-C subfamily serine protease